MCVCVCVCVRVCVRVCVCVHTPRMHMYSAYVYVEKHLRSKIAVGEEIRFQYQRDYTTIV
jgi:hypothetical protein